MSLSLLQVLSILGVPLLLGAALLRTLGITRRTDALAYLGWCWLAGTLGLGVVLSAWAWCVWPLDARLLAPVLLVLAGLLGFGARHRARFEPAAPAAHGGREEWLFRALLAFVLLATLARIQLAPLELVVDGDEAHIWSARAKALFVAGGFDARFAEFLASGRVFDHPDYPPLNPLLQTWVLTHTRALVHAENRLPIQCMGLACVLVAASALRRRLRPALAAAFLAVVASIGLTLFSVITAFADMMVALALLALLDLWLRFEEDGERGWLLLAALLAPFLLWSKNEGWMLLLVLLGAIAAGVLLGRARAPRGPWPWLAPLAASALYLAWFNRHFALENDLVQGAHGEDFARAILHGARERLGTVLRHLAWRATQVPTHLLLPAFLVTVVLAPGRSFGRGRMVATVTVLGALAGYVAVYLGTHWELERHLESSSHRVLFHLMPAAGLLLAVHVAELMPWTRARKA